MVCKSCCHEQKKLKKGLWSPEEDGILKSYVLKYGQGCWREVPNLTGLERCGRSCRLRWINHLRPGVKRGDFSPQEETMLLNAHAIFGNRWSRIASMIPGRTDNHVKNFWNTHLKKKLKMYGTNPNVHGPPGESFQPRFHSVSQCPTHTEIEHVISSEFAPGVCTANFSSDAPSESMSWDLPSQWSGQSDKSIFSNNFSTSMGNTNTIDITEQRGNVGSMGISNDVNLQTGDDPKLFENCASLYWDFC